MRLDAHGLQWRDKSEDGYLQCVADVAGLELSLVAVPVAKANDRSQSLHPLSDHAFYLTPENRVAIDGEEHILLVTGVQEKGKAG